MIRPLQKTNLLVLLATLLTAVGFCDAQKPKTNVLMIAVDDLRPMLGCYGDANIQSPYIDQLAERGMLFERAYCQYAKCGTSRISLMTGLRPDSIGIFSNNIKHLKKFRQQRPEIAGIGQWFKRHGYHTQSFGKIYHDGWDDPHDWSTTSSPGRDREMWEIVDESDPAKPTMIADRWDCPIIQAPDVPDDHLFAGRMTNEVLALLAKPDSKPWFIAVGYRRPHLPFIAPKKYFDLYQPDSSFLAKDPVPPKDTSYISWFNSDGYGGGAKKIGLTMPNPPTRQQAIDWNGYELRSYKGVPKQGSLPEKTQIDLIHAYMACVSYIDTQIGRLMESIDLDNTVVVLWSDHGWHLGEKSAWGKMTNYEIANRVPLIFAGPDEVILKGKTKAFAELVDIYPTLCELTNIPKPVHLEGDSLAPILCGKAQSVKDHAVSQYERYNGKYKGRSIRSDRGRYLVWKDQNRNLIAEEFYQTETNPGETKNVIESLSEVERAEFLQDSGF